MIMKRIFLTTVILFILTFMGCAQWELKDVIEFQQRDGLPNFYHKVKNNEPVKVGYIGGSITRAEGWRIKTTEWLKEQYGINNMIDYSAAISGTGSKFGVFRINKHMLSKQDFDLIFIEFAVNDRDGISQDVERSMEGIVRKIWNANPYTDICFVYTVSKNFLPDIENGKMNLSATKHDFIASIYGIPSIFWGGEVNRLLKTGEVVWSDQNVNQETSQNSTGQYVFARDKEHPTEYGHGVYMNVLSKSFMQMEDVSRIVKHEINEPVFPDNYEKAQMLSANIPNNHGMQVISSKGVKNYLDRYIRDDTWFLHSNDPSSYYAFSFKGSEFGISEIHGPSSGKYIVEVDGKKMEYNAFDGLSTYWRQEYRFIKLSESGEHFVKIYPSPNSLSLTEKRDILDSDSRKQDLDEDPDKYKVNEFIFSDIMIDGSLTNYYVETMDVCEGEIAIWRDKELDLGGKYYDISILPNGFDLVYELDLNLIPAYHRVDYDTIIQGDSVLWEGSYYNSTGIFQKKHLSTLGCDSVMELNLTIQSFPTSLNYKLESDFRVYPNPASDNISLLWSKSVSGSLVLRITNMVGEIIYNQTFASADMIDLVDLSSNPPGIYFLTIELEAGSQFAKFMKL